MSPADTSTPKPLRDLMWRVGSPVTSGEFRAAVVEAFRHSSEVSDAEVYARFHQSGAWKDFQTLLRQARIPKGARILCIGCGKGLAGRSSVYAAAVVREVYPAADPVLLDVEPELPQATAPLYDAIVTHSLLHFFYDPDSVCAFVRDLLVPNGAYVMANEPNARFWSNPECVRELRFVDTFEGRRHRLRRYTDPARYWQKLVRVVSPTQPPDPIAQMNLRLRERIGLHADLSAKEIVRIVDPHQPDVNSGDFRYGSDGLRWTELGGGLKMEAVRTSGYLMRDNPIRVPNRWREVDDRLAKEYPLDGCSFSALWRKP